MLFDNIENDVGPIVQNISTDFISLISIFSHITHPIYEEMNQKCTYDIQ